MGRVGDFRSVRTFLTAPFLHVVLAFRIHQRVKHLQTLAEGVFDHSTCGHETIETKRFFSNTPVAYLSLPVKSEVVPDKRANRKSEVLVRDLSGNPTYQASESQSINPIALLAGNQRRECLCRVIGTRTSSSVYSVSAQLYYRAIDRFPSYI
jgi:hypothetical protein